MAPFALAAAFALATAPVPTALPSPQALFAAACAGLEAGDLAAAERAVAGLAAQPSPPPEAKVLAALLARRRASPSEPMTDALAAAWKTAGRPDLRQGSLLARDVETEVAPKVTAEALARLPAEEAFLLGGLTLPGRSAPPELIMEAVERRSAARHAQAMVLAARSDHGGLALDLALYAALEPGPQRDAVRERLQRALPANGTFAAMEVLDGTVDEAPLTPAELDALELALARPELTSPPRVTYDALRRAARRLVPSQAADPDAEADRLARAALESARPHPSFFARLNARAQATSDPALRARAAVMLARAARTLARDPTVLARIMGVILERSSLRLEGDEAGALAIGARSEAWLDRIHSAQQALLEERWPLPSLWREWDPELEAIRAERLAE